MKIFLNVIAVLLILFGAGWFFQGIGVLGGSMMTGQIQWAIYGGIAFLAGIGWLVFANRKRPPSSKTEK